MKKPRKDAVLDAVETFIDARNALDRLPPNAVTRRARKHLERAAISLLPLLAEVS